MLRVAARFGDPNPASITAVATNWSEAIHAATTGSIPANHVDRPLYFVVMTGNFTLPRGNPVGGAKPTGRYLRLLFNPFTPGGSSHLGLGDVPPPVAPETFGPVSDLTEPL
jgi:hypothetical protein